MRAIFSTMDSLLRDRDTLYRQAREGRSPGALCGRLLAVFLLTAAIYGAVMGSFRLFHPQFFFSDFILSTEGSNSLYGKVAGMDPDARAVFAEEVLPDGPAWTTVRFNRTRPTAPYRVAAVGEEQGYGRIQLAPDAVLAEAGAGIQVGLVALKIPLLFLLTLAVCALALYILNLVFGLGLRFVPAITLMLFALAATGVLLAVFAPIVLFFTAVTANYHFMKVMHVLVFGIAGLYGVKVLGDGLWRLTKPDTPEDPAAAYGAWMRAKVVLCSWLVLYCLVGAQVAWTLKPFLGTPYLPATPPFRLERGNIFVSFFESTARIPR